MEDGELNAIGSESPLGKETDDEKRMETNQKSQRRMMEKMATRREFTPPI
ncbi:MAG: hypothetical protein V1728_06245 [Candidatus Micrarchaeota archaeon]